MSKEKKDRLERVDRATDRVRTELDEAIDESKGASGEVSEDARAAIGDVEARIDLRNRTEA
jgi:hypothetical protein